MMWLAVLSGALSVTVHAQETPRVRRQFEVDERGYVHLAGNMHNNPLVYFRTTEAYDVSTFARIDRMVGTQEQRCTYPQFIHGRRGELIFLYRDGSSGDGAHLVNRYGSFGKTCNIKLGDQLSGISFQVQEKAFFAGFQADN